uniref:Poly-gamma-glutamate synthase PgsB n=1 Tax=candidate division WOR-3 bacterium TaxID=2052148 RepID=A0A7C4TAY9_UNCW3
MEMGYGILLLFLLLLLFIFLGILEWTNHQNNLKLIPLRIMVNGTRGKSTVTRLLGAALKAGGYKTLAKTTGTTPRIVIDNRIEIPVIRPGKANIREQLAITRKAVKENVNAIVFENMSLRPDLQYIEESRIMQPQIVAITNVRADHLEVMGPTLEDIARNFINAVPQNAKVFTAERSLFPLLQELANRRGIEIYLCTEDEVSDEELKKFPYIEHRENIALVLGICKYLGIPREVALNEMYNYIPDAGVLKKYYLKVKNKDILLYNALAANDPHSTYLIYQRIERPEKNFYVILNCRSDRIDRSVQLGKLISEKIKADYYFLTGGETRVAYHSSVKSGMKKERLIDLGGKDVEYVFNKIVEMINDKSVILAIGNIVGYGEKLIEYFKKYEKGE